jgi:hypothetical protein
MKERGFDNVGPMYIVTFEHISRLLYTASRAVTGRCNGTDMDMPAGTFDTASYISGLSGWPAYTLRSHERITSVLGMQEPKSGPRGFSENRSQSQARMRMSLGTMSTASDMSKLALLAHMFSRGSLHAQTCRPYSVLWAQASSCNTTGRSLTGSTSQKRTTAGPKSADRKNVAFV